MQPGAGPRRHLTPLRQMFLCFLSQELLTSLCRRVKRERHRGASRRISSTVVALKGKLCTFSITTRSLLRRAAVLEPQRGKDVRQENK